MNEEKLKKAIELLSIERSLIESRKIRLKDFCDNTKNEEDKEEILDIIQGVEETFKLISLVLRLLEK